MSDEKTQTGMVDRASRWGWAMPPEPSPREKTVKILAEGILEMILAGNGPRRVRLEQKRRYGRSR